MAGAEDLFKSRLKSPLDFTALDVDCPKTIVFLLFFNQGFQVRLTEATWLHSPRGFPLCILFRSHGYRRG